MQQSLLVLTISAPDIFGFLFLSLAATLHNNLDWITWTLLLQEQATLRSLNMHSLVLLFLLKQANDTFQLSVQLFSVVILLKVVILAAYISKDQCEKDCSALLWQDEATWVPWLVQDWGLIIPFSLQDT